MAENNTGVSSLDPLGPEYGRINAPSLDAQGITPFEGSNLTDPRIDFPRPTRFVPAVPGLDLTQPQQNIRQNIVGTPASPAKPTNLEDLKKAHIDYVRSLSQANQDKNSYAKIYSYDASPDGNAFYKRYLAYGPETFSKIGFSPLRDNEANFNAGTTMWDDWGRMMKHSFWPLFSRGFVSGPASLGRMLQGDFSGTDLEDAEAYEEAAAIGQSSKSGVSAFLNNTFMNFGYTAGIMSEAIIEEIGLAVITGLTAGGTAPVLFARTGQNLKRIFKGFDFIREGIKPISETLRKANNIEDVRKIWSVAKSPTARAFGRFVNPLENTFDALKAIKADNITGLAKVSKTAGGLYRDLRTVNMAISEARLEAGMVENKVYRDLYNEHYKLTGEAPDNTLQKQMRQQAKDASFDTWLWNTALIYGTNKITFGNITSPRGGINRYIKSITEDFAEIGGKYGKMGKIVYNNTKKAFEFEANNLKNLAKSWYRQPGLKTLGKTIGYMKANFSEGLQENFQEVIARTNENYYKDSFTSPYRQSHEYAKGVSKYLASSQSEYFLKELGKEFSLEGTGVETFASGFFMGMFASPINKAIPFLSEQVNRFKDPETYRKYKETKIKMGEGLAETLNAINIKDFLNSKLFTASAQDLLQIRREQQGDKKTSLDTEFESLIDAVSDMINTKTTKHFTDTLENFLKFNDEEFTKEFGITAEEIPAFKTRITNSIERINQIEKSYNYYQEKFPNPVNMMNLDDMDEDSDEYKDLVSLKFGWDLGIKNAVFFRESFNDTMKRMVDIMDKFTSTTFMKNTSQSEMRLLFEPDVRMRDEMTALTKEIEIAESLETKDDTTKESLRKKKRKLEDLQKFSDAYRVFDIFFNRSKYYNSLRSKEEYKDMTDQELSDLLDQDLGPVDSEEKQLSLIADLKNAFDNYMSNLAEDANDYTFDENLEEAFNLLLDHYKLGSEAQAMGYFINMLHNPKNFNDLAERNRQWMRNLYENRSEYYEQMVKREIENIEDNTLLNRLADKGIYISIDDLEAWKTSRIIPDEFFDNVNKKVIQEGSAEYNSLVEFFMKAAEAKIDNVDLRSSVLNKELQAKLDALDAKMNSEIEALEKEEKVTVIGNIIPNAGSAFFTVVKIDKETQPGETVTATNTKGETVTFTKNEEGILVDEAGNAVSGKTRFVEAQRSKVTYEPNPEQVKEIEERYNKLKIELMEDFEQKKSEVKKPVVFEDQTIEDIKTNDPELYNQLFAAFEKYTIDDIGEETYNALVDSQKENLFNKYISSAQGKLIIDEYNQKKKVEESIDEEAIEEFEFDLDGKTISTKGANVKQLRNYIKTFTKKSQDIRQQKIITEDDKLRLLSYQNKINNLQSIINKRLSEGMPQPMIDSIKEIEKLVKLQSQVVKQDLKSITIPIKERPLSKWADGEVRYTKFGNRIEKQGNQYLVDGKTFSATDTTPSFTRLVSSAIYSKNPTETPNVYMINGSEYERVSNVIKSAFDPFGYKDIDKVENAFDSTIGTAPLTETSIKSFIEALKKEKLEGFNSQTYTDLEDSLLAIYDAGQLGLATGFESTTPVSDIEAKKADIENPKISAEKGAGAKMTGDTVENIERIKDIENQLKKLRSADGSVAKENLQEFQTLSKKLSKLKTKSETVTQIKERLKPYNIVDIFYSTLSGIPRLNNPTAFTVLFDKFLEEGFTEDQAIEILNAAEEGSAKGLKTFDRLLNAKYKAELAALEGSTTAGVFTPTTPYGTPKGPQLTTATTEQPATNAIKNFVLNTVTESTYEASKTLGTYTDLQTKNVLENKAAQRDPERISEDAFDELFNPKTGYMTSIAERASKGEFKIFTDIVVWNEYTDANGNLKRVAGEIDMLIVDTEGKIFIVDLKTGKLSKWSLYNTPGTWGNDKKKDNTLQQLAYSNLLFNQINKTTNIGILPIEIKYNEETMFIESAGRPLSKSLFTYTDMTLLKQNAPFTVPLNKQEPITVKDADGNIIQTTAQDLIDKLIPRKTLVVPGEDIERESGSDEDSPATKKPQTKPEPKGTKRQTQNYKTFDETLDSINDLDQLESFKTEITLAYLQEEITAEMKDELINKIDDKITERFVADTFESSEVMPILKDKFILVEDIFTTETIGKSKKEVSFESGTQFTVTAIDDKTKMVTLEVIFKNKKVEVMISNEELQKSFMKEGIINVAEKVSVDIEEEIDPTTVDILNQTAGNFDSFMSNQQVKKEAAAQAKKQSSKEALNQLSKLPKCGEQ